MGPRLWDAETSSTNAELIFGFWWLSSAAAGPGRAFDADSYWPFNLDGPASEGWPGHCAPCGGIR